jgi:TRAP-type C4-dicarboxylate transport system substrate-binding protein
VELRVASWVPPAHALTSALEAWGKSIASSSKGTIRYKLFPAQQLGKAQDHYDMVRDGTADVTFVSPDQNHGRFPLFGVAALPLLVSNAKGGSAALDEWYRSYAAKEMKEVRFCLAFTHEPGVWHSKRKFSAPEEIKGLRVRAPHAAVANLVASLGGRNVQASVPEVRQMLESNTADAVAFPWGAAIRFKIEQVAKFHMDLPLYTTPFALVLNRAVVAGMSEAQQKVIDDHCKSEWAVGISTLWAADEIKGREQLMKRPGHQVYQLAPAQVERWRKAADRTKQQWAAQLKKDGWSKADVLSEFKAVLIRHKSLVE